MGLKGIKHNPRKVRKSNFKTRNLTIHTGVWRDTKGSGGFCAFASIKRKVKHYDLAKRTSGRAPCASSPTKAIKLAVERLLARTH